MPDNRDDLFDEDTEDTQDEGDARSGESTPPDDSSDPTASENSDKRVNDLMAKFRKEQARANKAEAALKAASGGAAGQPTSDEGETNSSTGEFEQFMRESVRTNLYERHPELKEYGLQASDIAGASVEEMRASVERHRKLIQKIEGTAKQRVLTEHGLTPDIGGSVSTDPKDWDSMPRDEFEKAVQAALNRG